MRVIEAADESLGSYPFVSLVIVSASRASRRTRSMDQPGSFEASQELTTSSVLSADFTVTPSENCWRWQSH